jgi:hypothetical protein
MGLRTKRMKKYPCLLIEHSIINGRGSTPVRSILLGDVSDQLTIPDFDTPVTVDGMTRPNPTGSGPDMQLCSAGSNGRQFNFLDAEGKKDAVQRYIARYRLIGGTTGVQVKCKQAHTCMYGVHQCRLGTLG